MLNFWESIFVTAKSSSSTAGLTASHTGCSMLMFCDPVYYAGNDGKVPIQIQGCKFCVFFQIHLRNLNIAGKRTFSKMCAIE